MEKIKDTISILEFHKPFRDILILICGIFGLVLIAIFYGENIPNFQILKNLNQIELGIVYITCSYLLGRLLSFFFDFSRVIIENIKYSIGLIVLFDQNSTRRLKEYWINKRQLTRKYLSKSFKKDDLETVSQNMVRNEITVIDQAKVAREFPSLASSDERNIYALTVSRCLFSLSLLAGLYFENYYLIFISTLFYAEASKIIEELNEHRYQIYRAIVKESANKQ